MRLWRSNKLCPNKAAQSVRLRPLLSDRRTRSHGICCAATGKSICLVQAASDWAEKVRWKYMSTFIRSTEIHYCRRFPDLKTTKWALKVKGQGQRSKVKVIGQGQMSRSNVKVTCHRTLTTSGFTKNLPSKLRQCFFSVFMRTDRQIDTHTHTYMVDRRKNTCRSCK